MSSRRNSRSNAGDYYLEANFEVGLTHTLEDALNKGLPLHFVIEFELIRPRWYTLYLWNKSVRRTGAALPAVLQRADPPVPAVAGCPAPEFRHARRSAGIAGPRAPAFRRRMPICWTRTRSTKPRSACAWTFRNCPSRSRSTRSASRDWNLSSDWYRWTVRPMRPRTRTVRRSLLQPRHEVSDRAGAAARRGHAVPAVQRERQHAVVLERSAAAAGLRAWRWCLVLMLVVGYQLLVLRRRLKARVFGSKLTLRLVLLFSLVAVLPGALVYAVSVQFLSRSIESWFDVRVDKALEGGLSLGRVNLDNMLKDLRRKAESMTLVLAERATPRQLAVAQHAARAGRGARSDPVADPTVRVIAFSERGSGRWCRNCPPRPWCARFACSSPTARSRRSAKADCICGYWCPSTMCRARRCCCSWCSRCRPQLARDAQTVQEIYRDYQELSLSRQGLKRLYALDPDAVAAAGAAVRAAAGDRFQRASCPRRLACSPPARARSRKAISASAIR